MSKKVNTLVTIEEATKFAGMTKKALEAMDKKEVRTLSKNMDEFLGKNKDLDASLNKKINVRINWIESILDTEIDETINNIINDEISVTVDSKQGIQKVASTKKIIKNKKTAPATPETAPETQTTQKTNKTSKTNKAENKAENVDKKTLTNDIAIKDIPNIKPTNGYYVQINDSDKAVLQVIYLDKESNNVVLLDAQGTINCYYDSFMDNIVEYHIGKNSYAFRIIKSFQH